MKSIAENKKSKNLPEYLIYMYQMEDLIRSYQGNLEEIKKYVISHYPISDEEKIEVSNWFSSLISKMIEERIMEKGHLSELKVLVDQLAEIHWSLLKKDSTYFQLFSKAKPFILEFIHLAKEENLGNEIQICLNGVYGLLLSRLLGKKVADEQLKATEIFGEILSYINFTHQQRLYLSPN
jgi:hypothetical protein